MARLLAHASVLRDGWGLIILSFLSETDNNNKGLKGNYQSHVDPYFIKLKINVSLSIQQMSLLKCWSFTLTKSPTKSKELLNYKKGCNWR